MSVGTVVKELKMAKTTKVKSAPAGSLNTGPGKVNLGQNFSKLVPSVMPQPAGGADPVMQFIKAGRGKVTR